MNLFARVRKLMCPQANNKAWFPSALIILNVYTSIQFPLVAFHISINFIKSNTSNQYWAAGCHAVIKESYCANYICNDFSESRDFMVQWATRFVSLSSECSNNMLYDWLVNQCTLWASPQEARSLKCHNFTQSLWIVLRSRCMLI